MIYLHIGKAKTGSTTIQGALFTNKESLLGKGLFYPNNGIIACAHHNFYYEITKDSKYNPSLGSLADLSEELTAHRKVNPDSGILLSSETFEALSVVEFAYLYEFLKKIDDVKVVLLLRRQDEYLLSYWSMLVKSLKVSQPFGIWAREQIQIDNDVNNTFSYGLDYYKFINKLISVVGVSNIKVRGYTEMTKGDLFHNFINLFGINSKGMKTYNSLNTPLCPLGLELSRVLSEKYSSKLSPERKKTVSDCIYLISKRNSWHKLWPSKDHIISNDDYNFIRNEYQNSNEKIINQFPALVGDLTFEERIIPDHELCIEIIPTKDLLDLAIFTMVAKKDK